MCNKLAIFTLLSCFASRLHFSMLVSSHAVTVRWEPSLVVNTEVLLLKLYWQLCHSQFGYTLLRHTVFVHVHVTWCTVFTIMLTWHLGGMPPLPSPQIRPCLVMKCRGSWNWTDHLASTLLPRYIGNTVTNFTNRSDKIISIVTNVRTISLSAVAGTW